MAASLLRAEWGEGEAGLKGPARHRERLRHLCESFRGLITLTVLRGHARTTGAEERRGRRDGEGMRLGSCLRDIPDCRMPVAAERFACVCLEALCATGPGRPPAAPGTTAGARATPTAGAVYGPRCSLYL